MLQFQGVVLTEDLNLLIEIANIAGIFVGFGALISVTRRAEINALQLGLIRAVVTIGLVVIVAALIPIGLGRFGLVGHDLWLISSLIFLILTWATTLLSLRSRENRQLTTTRTRSHPINALILWIFLEVPMQVFLVLAVLGLFPQHEPAFYLAALAFNLFQAVFILVQLVYSQVDAQDT